jgi:hypothetical protein
MVQFKQSFEGIQSPVASRCTTHQKCVRAGGKHNDLDNVVRHPLALAACYSAKHFAAAGTNSSPPHVF